MATRASHILVVVGAFAAGLLIFLGVILYATGQFGGPAGSAIGGPFKLTGGNGQPITNETFKGKPYLVFFGYTHCPDVCPTTLFEMSQMMKALGKDADRTAGLFITVDPERDTPAVMKDYLSNFDPHLIGATGDPKTIEKVEKEFRVYRQKGADRERRLQHGPQRGDLPDGQAGPLRRAVQPQAQAGGSRRRR